MSRLTLSECIPWLVVLITECLAIVILNIITIIVFVKQRQLQRRSTYLIIHLAAVDLLVGAVSGPLQVERYIGTFCGLWEYKRKKTLPNYVKFAFMHLFSFTSLVNLIFISLERLHATFRPFRHRYIRKRVYGIVITAIWLTTSVRESVQIVLEETGRWNLVNHTLYIPVYVISVLIICITYLLIVIKVRCRRHPYHSGAARRERKLTGTSLIVALVSLLFYLPVIIYVSVINFHLHSLSNLSWQSRFHIEIIITTLFLANSIVNPIIYSMRMPEFRSGVSQIFRRHRNRANPVDLPLRNLRRA